jgi:hypothetical protein
MIADKRVCGIIDLEGSGFFPPYWEWLNVKKFSPGHPEGSWFCLLEKRLKKENCPGWEGMWEVEKLLMALEDFSGRRLTPAEREMSQKRGWAKVISILALVLENPLQVTYEAKHPYWLESVAHREETQQGEGDKAAVQVNEVTLRKASAT